MEIIPINVSKNYEILLEEGLLAHSAGLIAKAAKGAKKLCLVCDNSVYKLHGGESSPLRRSLASTDFKLFIYVLPSGETNKNISSVTALTDFLAENHFTRNDVIIAFGGGITGDIAGFAASIYMRGIRFIQIPTTLLAMADSSVGGKTGVNTAAGKNMVGTFWQPEIVLVDPAVLNTLPKKELLNGLAEIIKAGIIGDVSIFDSISEGLFPAIIKAIDVKRRIISDDEREYDNRRILNFGHTIGHAIEKHSGYKVAHGNAIMTGMYLTSLAADSKGWSEEPVSGYIKTIIDTFAYPVITKYSAKELVESATNDKKADGDNIVIVFPIKPGFCQMRAIPQLELEEFIDTGLKTVR